MSLRVHSEVLGWGRICAIPRACGSRSRGLGPGPQKGCRVCKPSRGSGGSCELTQGTGGMWV